MKPFSRFALSVFAVFTAAGSALAQNEQEAKFLTEAELKEYCAGVALGQNAVMLTLLRHNPNELSIEKLRKLSIAQATGPKELTSLARVAAATHVNAFTPDHVNTMEQQFSAVQTKMQVNRPALLQQFTRDANALAKKKFSDCSEDLRAAGRVR